MRGIPTITKNLLIINILAFAADYVLRSSGISLNNFFGLHFFLASHFHIYQLVTYMFMHGGFSHLFFNMFALWMFGCAVERAWGEKRFLFFYMACGIGAGLMQEGVQFVEYAVQGLAAYDRISDGISVMPMDAFLNQWMTVGASGAVYGILLGFGLTYPEERIFIFPLPVPIKGKWFVCIYAAVELFSAIANGGDGIAHMAHLGGMLVGYIIIRYWRNGHGGSRYGGWDGYEIRESKSVIDKIKDWFTGLSDKFNSRKSYDRNDDSRFKVHRSNNRWESSSTEQQSDWDYNAQEKKREEEMDRILDKVRRSGYQSLTDDEKRKLFDRK